MDACFSGKMCFNAKKWWEENKLNCEKEDQVKLKVLLINGSTYRHNKGIWGKLTKFKEDSSVPNITNKKMVELKHEYSDEVGLTVFSSNVKEMYLL